MSDVVVENVTKTYGEVLALEDLSLTVDAGFVGLLGTNGAGKTTLFKLLLGLDRPDDGHIEVLGRSPDDGEAVRERVGYLPERAEFPDRLTGREVLEFHARVRGVPVSTREDRVTRLLAVVGLADAADRAVGGYSNGMNRRLGLATALVGNPDLLLLDEPTAGLDPLGIERFHDAVERLGDELDLTVVFASHALAEVERLCDRVILIHQGTRQAAGPVEELRATQGTPTVSASFADEAGASAAATRVRALADVETVEQVGDRLRVDTADPYAVLEAARAEQPPTSFEVREPGLDRLFHSITGGEAP